MSICQWCLNMPHNIPLDEVWHCACCPLGCRNRGVVKQTPKGVHESGRKVFS